MNAAGIALLAHLVTAGPTDCQGNDRSGGRALSDSPYEVGPRCTDTTPEPPQRGEPLPSNAALDSAVSPNQRIGFGLIGTGASLVVLGSLIAACSATALLPGQQKFCRDAWPWVAGTGLAFAGVGVGFLVVTSNSGAALAAAREREWTTGLVFSWALP